MSSNLANPWKTDLDNLKKYGFRFSLSAFRSSNDFSWSKYKQNDTGLSVDILVIIYKNYIKSRSR